MVQAIMSFLRDPFWQFIISTCIAIAGIIIPLLVGFFQSKGGGGSPQMSMSPSSNSSGCWIVPTVIVSIILIFFIVFSGFVFTFISQVIGSSSFPTNMPSSPDQVLNSYCQDIQSGAYQQAYDEYSTKLKSKVTSSQLTQMWADQHLDSCTHNSVVESTNAANTTLSTHDFFTKNITNYSVTLIRDGNNGWKIDNIQQQ
jgi:hypothetical protein